MIIITPKNTNLYTETLYRPHILFQYKQNKLTSCKLQLYLIYRLMLKCHKKLASNHSERVQTNHRLEEIYIQLFVLLHKQSNVAKM